MEFTKTPIDWQNKGTEPSSDIKTNGFTAGYKPPAEYHNYLFANAADCIKEVQQKLSAVGDNTKSIKSLEGQQVTPQYGEASATAEVGATIIGDLRDRTYNPTGQITAGNVAFAKYSIAIGEKNTAVGEYSMAIGDTNHTGDYYAVAIGVKNKSSALCAFTFGNKNIASEEYSVAIGEENTASGSNSFAIGNNNNANGDFSFAIGIDNVATNYQFKIGKHSKKGTGGTSTGITGDAFTIGNGTFNTLGNAFRVTYEGKAYGLSAYGSSGADYAEYFEWTDGNPNNEDRRGRLVTLDGEKIRFATANDDYILGVISATPCVEGDNFSEDWQGKYLTDVFGQKLTQTVHVPAKYKTVETVDPETGETTTEQVLIEEEHDEIQWVLNPDFDDTKEYVSREFRKEWSPVGLMGKLVVVDDGTCEVNGYCEAGENGIATTADSGYRVLSRIDDTHIRVLIK